MNIDLNSMSRKELLKLQKDVAKAIESLEDREKATALAAAEKAAAEHGFSLAQLAGSLRGKRAQTKGVARYRNPENPAQTWTGKGRRPNWIIQGEASGRSLSDFEI